jgi:hypothetical protein
MKNTMTDLRNHLFEVMEALKDKEEPMDIARAKAVVDVAQTIVNSAKVEVEFLNAIDSSEATGFFENRRRLAPALPETRMRSIAS